jgi:hypothetical protein
MRRVLHSILLSLFIFALDANGVTFALRAKGAAAATGAQSDAGKPARITYHTYANARFKYSISYPAGVLYPQGEADNGDGQKFLSKDGRATMLVYGGHKLDAVSLSEIYEATLKQKGLNGAGRDVTMKLLKTDWFVVSGYAGEKVFYQKTMLKGGVFKTFIIEYDREQKSFYDPITACIARSFVG